MCFVVVCCYVTYRASQALDNVLDAHARAAVKRVSQQCSARRMQKTFRSLDTNGTGTLEEHAFKKGLTMLGLDPKRDDFDTIWSLANRTGSGVASYVRHGIRWDGTCSRVGSP